MIRVDVKRMEFKLAVIHSLELNFLLFEKTTINHPLHFY